MQYFKRYINKALGLILLTLVVITLVGFKLKQDVSGDTIVVSGTSSVYAKPDLGLITASVVTEKKTVAEAVAENTDKMNAIISAIKEEGVEEKDLKTTYFNIYPKYEWREATYYTPGQRVLVGYEVQQSLEVKIRDLDNIGSIIQVATDNGANQMSDLRLTIDNADALKEQARAEAIDKAKDKAKVLSKQLGVRIKKIVGFSEGSVAAPYAPSVNSLMLEKQMDQSSVSIELGENKVEVTVHITYRIK